MTAAHKTSNLVSQNYKLHALNPSKMLLCDHNRNMCNHNMHVCKHACMHMQTHIFKHIHSIKKKRGWEEESTTPQTSPSSSICTCCVIVWQIVPPIVNMSLSTQAPKWVFTHHTASHITCWPFFEISFCICLSHNNKHRLTVKTTVSVHIVLPMIMRHISTTTQTICESLMSVFCEGIVCFKLTAWASLCHVNRPGIKGYNITHPCGWATMRRRLWLGSFSALVLRRPHWNIFHCVLKQSQQCQNSSSECWSWIFLSGFQHFRAILKKIIHFIHSFIHLIICIYSVSFFIFFTTSKMLKKREADVPVKQSS